MAVICKQGGKDDTAEMWYRKAIAAFRQGGNSVALYSALHNFAILLRTQPIRLTEARQLAEEALAITQTLDPGAAQIWTIYKNLAMIEDQESQAATDTNRKAELLAQARDHRRLARQTKFKFPGTSHKLRKHVPVILGAIRAIQEPKHHQEFEQVLDGMKQHGWTNLVTAIRRILAGERDADALCDSLDLEDSMIVETIIQGLADPSTLADLLPPEAPK